MQIVAISACSATGSCCLWLLLPSLAAACVWAVSMLPLCTADLPLADDFLYGIYFTALSFIIMKTGFSLINISRVFGRRWFREIFSRDAESMMNLCLCFGDCRLRHISTDMRRQYALASFSFAYVSQHYQYWSRLRLHSSRSAPVSAILFIGLHASRLAYWFNTFIFSWRYHISYSFRVILSFEARHTPFICLLFISILDVDIFRQRLATRHDGSPRLFNARLRWVCLFMLDVAITMGIHTDILYALAY